jgi:hypothetical protein
MKKSEEIKLKHKGSHSGYTQSQAYTDQKNDLHANWLANPTQGIVDEQPIHTAELYSQALEMTSTDLFEIDDISHEKIIAQFSKQFDKLKDQRVAKELSEIKTAFAQGKISKKEQAELDAQVNNMSKSSSLPLSSGYPKNRKEHSWILEGMKEYYFDDSTVASKYISDKIEKRQGAKVIEEFVSAIKDKKQDMIKQRAYKAIGKLFVEIENKHLPALSSREQFKGDLNVKIDNHYLNMLETHPDKLRDQLKDLLSKKLISLQPKKSKAVQEPTLLEQDEFIGEDEVISTQAMSREELDESITIIPSPMYKEDYNTYIASADDVHNQSKGVDTTKVSGSYQDHTKNQIEEVFGTFVHNNQEKQKYTQGQEGVDFSELDYEKDPNAVNQRKFKRYLEKMIKKYHKEKPKDDRQIKKADKQYLKDEAKFFKVM